MHKKMLGEYKDKKVAMALSTSPNFTQIDKLCAIKRKYKKVCDMCDERKRCVLHFQSYNVDASVFVFLCDNCLEYVLSIEKEAEHYTSSDETMSDSSDEFDSETDIIYGANYIE